MTHRKENYEVNSMRGGGSREFLLVLKKEGTEAYVESNCARETKNDRAHWRWEGTAECTGRVKLAAWSKGSYGGGTTGGEKLTDTAARVRGRHRSEEGESGALVRSGLITKSKMEQRYVGGVTGKNVLETSSFTRA